MKKSKIGVIGCGAISSAYFSAAQRCKNLDFIAAADIDLERAKKKAAEFNVSIACSVDDLLKNKDVEIVINLTIPKVHAEIALRTLEAGKHSYGEKPLAVNREEGRRVMELAQQKNLRVGSAPDTFLGAGIQTARKVIDDNLIGNPVAATAFMLCHGHETWHPDPEFYYQPGGGPMFDMGPYYLTALVNLMGPIRRVTGSARVTFPERLITSQPKHGTKITVNTPTHLAGVLDFANGAVGTMITSFDVHAHTLPNIQIYGTDGSMQVPDPNGFGGKVLVKRHDEKDWHEVPHAFAENARGIGVADLASAIQHNRPGRASGQLAFHVLDAMQAFLDASAQNKHIELTTKTERPAALPTGLAEGEID